MPHARSVVVLAWWLAFTLLIAASLRAQSPDDPLTLAEYRAELLQLIDELAAASPEEEEATVSAIQEHLETLTHVKIADGEVVNIRSILADYSLLREEGQDFYAETLLSSPKDVALTRLRSAVAQIDASVNDNTAARLVILAEILARPEFNSPMSLWDRFWQWIEQLISDLFPDSQSGDNAGWLAMLIRLLPWIIAIAFVAAVLWLFSYWLQRLLRAFVSDARLEAETGDDDLPRSAAEARQQARAAAESGLYRDAVRRLYLAALLQLAESHLITYERSLTNREVLVRIPPDSPIRPHLEPVIATFDRVWYGIHEPDQATFATYEQEIDALAAVAQAAVSDVARRGED